MEKKKYYLVSAEALPEVFIKVAEAKRMLQVGEAATVGEAARMVGISRSAFYKYKDAVQPFQNMRAGHIITFYALLKDIPGVLSNYLSIFANSGANILTINQTIPTNGCAGVTISAETSEMVDALEELMARQPFPVTHLWQEDCGFRKNRMLNKAVVQSRAEYLIFLDGDCIPHRKFVEEHCKARREGFVVAGRRVDRPAALSEGMSVGKVASPGF